MALLAVASFLVFPILSIATPVVVKQAFPTNSSPIRPNLDPSCELLLNNCVRTADSEVPTHPRIGQNRIDQILYAECRLYLVVAKLCCGGNVLWPKQHSGSDMQSNDSLPGIESSVYGTF
jgi:hypothetical protein